MIKLSLASLMLVAFYLISITSFSQESLILKKRIAVVKFANGTNGATRFGGAQAGDYAETLRTLLNGELVRSGAFIVFEREQLKAIFNEQDLGANGIVTRESAVKANQLLGVQLLVFGSIVEWGTNTQTTKNKVPFYDRSKSTTTAKVTVDLKIEDATTGQVIIEETETGTADSKSVSSGTVYYKDEKQKSDNTIMDSAVRKAVINCVELAKRAASKISWQGAVAKVGTDGRIYITPGSASGVKIGMKFIVYQKGEEIKDPSTGESLGSELSPIGTITITGDFGDGKGAIARLDSGKGIKVGNVVKPQQ